MKPLILALLSIILIDCKNEPNHSEPALCQIKSDFWNLAEDEEYEIMLDLQLFGIEQNDNSPYFFVSYSSMSGARLAYFTICNDLINDCLDKRPTM